MKTIEEKAADYCRNTHGICATCKKVKKCDIEEQIGNCKSKYPYYFTFLAGCESSNEWISVDDELPENETQIVMKNTEWVETMFYTSDDEESLKTEYTHWKPIN